MKKFYLLVSILVVLCISLSLFDKAYTRSSGSPGAYTGALGEQNCNSCHNNTLQTGATGTVTNTLTLNGTAASSYVPGTRYSLVLGITGGSGRHGFQIMAVNSANTSVGTFTAGTGNRVFSSGGRSYVTHSARYTSSTSTFTWTAPATGSGDVRFFAITYTGNSENSTSSILRTSEWTVTEASPTPTAPDISTTLLNALNSYPNPAIESLKLNVKGLSPQSLSLQIVNISGTIVKEIPVKILDHENCFTINVADLASGSYFILGQAKEGVIKSRFVKQ